VSSSATNRRATGFLVGFLLIALLIAGGLSYFASSDPDGLDSVTLSGCQLNADGEPAGGTCIARNAQDPATAGSPLADYSVAGSDGTVGLAGVLGVVVTLVVAGGLFWVLRRRGEPSSGDDS